MMGGSLIRMARKRARLSQAELANRLGTHQPVVARWETGARSPDFDTVVAAIRACGLEIDTGLRETDPQEESVLSRWLRMTPVERLRANEDMLETERWAHRAEAQKRVREP
ncbi:MAG: helix-turn-helix domain-containing protein [Actinomycetota bacterium]|nr:helix-turn-helix domain-containing protein [Actinomycetota bacterium]